MSLAYFFRPACVSVPSRCRFWAFALLLGLCSVAPGRAAPAETRYRGFTLDESAVRDLPNLAAVRAATQEQIDIVHAVGLPAEILAFFQSVPFKLVPIGTIPRGSPGFYGGTDRSVKVVANIVGTGHKPVLLHEFLHAYHEQRLPGGTKNHDVLAHYARAQQLPAYAATSHMMKNEREYFACTATTFLFGVTAQEPFQRTKLAQQQPEVIAYLRTLFGPESGHYVGSLSR